MRPIHRGKKCTEEYNSLHSNGSVKSKSSTSWKTKKWTTTTAAVAVADEQKN